MQEKYLSIRMYSVVKVFKALAKKLTANGFHICNYKNEKNEETKYFYRKGKYDEVSKEYTVSRYKNYISFTDKKDYYYFQIEENGFFYPSLAKMKVVSIKDNVVKYPRYYGENATDELNVDYKLLTDEEVNQLVESIYNTLIKKDYNKKDEEEYYECKTYIVE